MRSHHQILLGLILVFMLGEGVHAQEMETRTVFKLSCSLRCPNPIRKCNGCQAEAMVCGPIVLKQHSSISWVTDNGQGWTVRFKGKSPCQQRKFTSQNAVCELDGPPGKYRYEVTIAGCPRHKMPGTFSLIP